MIRKLFILNFAGLCLVAWAWTLGYVQQVLTGDASRLSYVIGIVFLGGLIYTFRKGANPAVLNDVAEWMVTLGLIGNVIGFILALSGMSGADIGSPEGAQQIATMLIAGMGVAFYSTFTGAALALWTTINRRLIESST